MTIPIVTKRASIETFYEKHLPLKSYDPLTTWSRNFIFILYNFVGLKHDLCQSKPYTSKLQTSYG